RSIEGQISLAAPIQCVAVHSPPGYELLGVRSMACGQLQIPGGRVLGPNQVAPGASDRRPAAAPRTTLPPQRLWDAEGDRRRLPNTRGSGMWKSDPSARLGVDRGLSHYTFRS